MDIKEYQWISMDIIGYQWISQDINECQWISKYQWMSQDINEYQWISKNINGYKCNLDPGSWIQGPGSRLLVPGSWFPRKGDGTGLLRGGEPIRRRV